MSEIENMTIEPDRKTTSDIFWERSAEQLRRVSAVATHQIVLRAGRRLDVTVGGGYPKSGTVWLCQLLSTYLGAPHPQNSLAPIAMRSVVHGHWRYDPRLPPTVYITRDGRDVMVSLYFYLMRAMTLTRNPGLRRRLQDRTAAMYGGSYDPENIRDNLPAFIEAQMADPITHTTWQRHVREWHAAPNVIHVRYEDLLTDPRRTFATAMTSLTGKEADLDLVDLSLRRYDFARNAGRERGTEDRSSFFRKGIAGDWENHFTYRAGEVFDRYAGDLLTDLGYAENRDWYRKLSS